MDAIVIVLLFVGIPLLVYLVVVRWTINGIEQGLKEWAETRVPVLDAKLNELQSDVNTALGRDDQD